MPYPSKTIKFNVLKAIVLTVTAFFCNPAASFAADAPPWTVKTKNRIFEVTLGPQDGPIRINTVQKWIVSIQDASGRKIHSANVQIDGGMRGHGHGLPTQPQITENLGEGRYLIEGLRLNMVGAWTLMIGVELLERRDVATFEFEIDY